MCGIYALFGDNKLVTLNEYNSKSEENILSCLKHRGPDCHGKKTIVHNDKFTTLIHTRLSINGDASPQPLQNQNGTIFLIINGEIFNWHELQSQLGVECKKSDCEIILYMYEQYKNDIPGLLNRLNGQYSFVLYDTISNKILVARDHIGITPLYIGVNSNEVAFCSEMKCLKDMDIALFPPRHYYYDTLNNLLNGTRNLICYYDIEQYKHTPDSYYEYSEEMYQFHKKNIKSLLEKSVELQLRDLLKDKSPDFGFLLSGGLDSSLIAAIAVNIAKRIGYTKPIKTFSIGVTKDVPDLKAARQVADFLGTEHHEYTFSTSQGLDMLLDVIWYTETYDCTTIRASTPMYILTKRIHEQFPKLKVLFSGELSDELFCYLYGANAPNIEMYQNETVTLVKGVHQFDCLRANKTGMANSIEIRVPFTDPDFVNYVLSINPLYKIFGKLAETAINKSRMEKQILRDSFAQDNLLPKDILYRKKEQFSDGVSGFDGENDNWIDTIRIFTEKMYDDKTFNQKCSKYSFNIPNTKEKLYFRELFHSIFNEMHYTESIIKTVSEWKPKWSETDDPSGRVQKFWSQN